MKCKWSQIPPTTHPTNSFTGFFRHVLFWRETSALLRKQSQADQILHSCYNSDRQTCLFLTQQITVRIKMPFKMTVWLVSWWPSSQLTAPGWMDNMLSPTLHFGNSNYDSTLKWINNNLSGRSSRSLSFSDKGEFVFDGLQQNDG